MSNLSSKVVEGLNQFPYEMSVDPGRELHAGVVTAKPLAIHAALDIFDAGKNVL
jgi:hypothetical protein